VSFKADWNHFVSYQSIKVHTLLRLFTREDGGAQTLWYESDSCGVQGHFAIEHKKLVT